FRHVHQVRYLLRTATCAHTPPPSSTRTRKPSNGSSPTTALRFRRRRLERHSRLHRLAHLIVRPLSIEQVDVLPLGVASRCHITCASTVDDLLSGWAQDSRLGCSGMTLSSRERFGEMGSRMARSPSSVREARVGELEQLSATLTDAFATDPILQWLAPSQRSDRRLRRLLEVELAYYVFPAGRVLTTS